LDLLLIMQVVLAGLFFGLISDVTITTLHKVSHTIKKIPFNSYLKAFGGGIILVGLSFIVGEQYFGLGLDTIDNILQPDPSFPPDIPWYGFFLKTIFTSITLGVGGSGGIVTPIFYIGATSGHLFGTLMGDHIAFFAALGFISVLAGTTNSPIAATIMAMELFGLEVAHFAAISVVISFLMTGHRSVFASQILAMKKSDILKIDLGEEISHTKVEIGDKERRKIENIRDRLQRKREQRQKNLKSKK